MKKYPLVCLLLAMTLLLGACADVAPDIPSTSATTAPTQPSTEAPTAASTEASTEAPTEPSTEETTEPPAQPHSDLYIPDVAVDEVLRYFNEVVLDSEFSDGGDSKLVQKWVWPVTYWIGGTPTDEDLAIVDHFAEVVNAVPGFPSYQQIGNEGEADLRIYFCDAEEMENRMGAHFVGGNYDGAVTFWYNGFNELTSEIICIRNDIDQQIRNSVILEELYNGLGPVQDTLLREDSIIYQYSSEAQELSEMDLLLLKLLYHSDILCGMTAEECEAVIRQLYY